MQPTASAGPKPGQGLPVLDGPDYYTPREVAARLKVSLRKVYEMLASGEIVATRIRAVLRVRREDLAAYLAQQPSEDELCEIAEAAQRLRVHQRTIYELIADGELTSIRIRGRRSRMLRRTELDEYLTRRRTSSRDRQRP